MELENIKIMLFFEDEMEFNYDILMSRKKELVQERIV